MDPTHYSTLMVRVGLEKTKLIELKDLITLIGKNMEEIYTFLKNSEYKECIEKVCGDTISHYLLEKALYENYSITIKKIVNNSSSYVNNLLSSMEHKFDSLNLKKMLKLINVGKGTNEILEHIIHLGIYNRKNCKEIIGNAKSVKDIILNIKKNQFGYFLNEIVDKDDYSERNHNLSHLITAIDTNVYQEIFKVINLLDGQDKSIATEIFGIEMDALNINILLKGKLMNLDFKEVEKNLMPSIKFNKKLLRGAYLMEGNTKMFEYLLNSKFLKNTIYKRVFTRLMAESDSKLSRLEFLLDLAPLEMSYYQFRMNKSHYNISSILALVYLKWFEIKNLRCIINGTRRNVPIDEIIQFISFPKYF